MKRRPTTSKPQPAAAPAIPEIDYRDFAARLKAMADPDRLRIVSCLFREPKNVSELASELGEQLVKVSHHLGVLRHADVVQTEKRGKFVVYRLDPEITNAILNHAHAVQTENGKFVAYRVDPALPGPAQPDEIKSLDLGCCKFDLPKTRDE